MANETIDKLKALLFEEESQGIGALNRRLDALAARLDVDKSELLTRIENLADRVGNDASLRRNVARILDHAITDAESDRHKEMTVALAPMVVRTVNAELTSPQTQDQLAGVLYPRIGEMVSRFVSDAMRDLMDRINRTLESGLMNNRMILRLRSMVSGRSMAELALANAQSLEIEELYLIRRGSGELVDRWSKKGDDFIATGSNRDTLVSGFLTALTAFAEEAFEADKASLRALDLGEHRIYLRGSPSHLLALKCKGSATQSVELLLDECLLRLLKPLSAAGETAGDTVLLPEMATDLTKRVEEREAEIRRRRSMRPLKILLWLSLPPLAALLGWHIYVRHETGKVQAEANRIIGNARELQDFPVQARVERGGQTIWVGGLVPDERARDLLLARLKSIAPDIEVTPSIGVLPRNDVAGEVASANFRRAVTRAARHLQLLEPELTSLSPTIRDPEARQSIETARSMLKRGLAALGPAPPAGPGVDALIGELIRTLDNLGSKLGSLSGAKQDHAATAEPDPEGGTSAVEHLVAVADRVRVLSALVRQSQMAERERQRVTADLQRQLVERDNALKALEASQAQIAKTLETLRYKPTPRQELEAFVRQNAVFFSANTDYRDPAATAHMLDELSAKLLAADGFIRLVGYTDDVGSAQRNQTLSLQRAEKVLDDLAQKGVPRNRVVAVGRGISFITPKAGGLSNANRRVEFEIGFIGEGTDGP